PLFLMCDQSDIRAHTEVFSRLADGMPALIFHDSVPGGIGLAEKIYEIFPELLREGQKVVSGCSCTDGCPACVGPVAENGLGAREKVRLLLEYLNDHNEG
ncbi:MAG: DUF1998 domain-containing protein, partial [Candidatus Cloacimonetes bacterium]|nr:DUF1998 domain-containing protein [Candidatus Cloacimonadota bacterium]